MMLLLHKESRSFANLKKFFEKIFDEVKGAHVSIILIYIEVKSRLGT